MPYKTHHLCQMFRVSHQTIKNWSGEFADYLSPTARVEKGKQRQFTDSDIAVLSLVAVLKQRRVTYDDIHAALQAGQRGELPEQGALLPVTPAATILALREEVAMLQEQIRNLNSQNDQQAGQIQLLKEMLIEAQRRIIELERRRL